MFSALLYAHALALPVNPAVPTITDKRIEVDGSGVVYSKIDHGDGSFDLVGTRLSDKTEFKFTVRKSGHVTGYVGDNVVRFRIRRQRG